MGRRLRVDALLGGGAWVVFVAGSNGDWEWGGTSTGFGTGIAWWIGIWVLGRFVFGL